METDNVECLLRLSSVGQTSYQNHAHARESVEQIVVKRTKGLPSGIFPNWSHVVIGLRSGDMIQDKDPGSTFSTRTNTHNLD